MEFKILFEFKVQVPCLYDFTLLNAEILGNEVKDTWNGFFHDRGQAIRAYNSCGPINIEYPEYMVKTPALSSGYLQGDIARFECFQSHWIKGDSEYKCGFWLFLPRKTLNLRCGCGGLQLPEHVPLRVEQRQSAVVSFPRDGQHAHLAHLDPRHCWLHSDRGVVLPVLLVCQSAAEGGTGEGRASLPGLRGGVDAKEE